MTCVSKSQFLKPLAPKTEKVPVPECGQDAYVIVKALSAREMLALQKLETGPHGHLDGMHAMLAAALVDDAGQPLFENTDDVAANFGLSFGSLEQLCKHVLRVSGVDAEKK